MEEFKLNLAERINLLTILPKEGDFLTLKVLRDLIDKVGIKDGEFKKYKIVQDGDQISWDSSLEDLFEIEFGEKQLDIIIKSLKDLDRTKKLRSEHFSLYEKFVQEKKNDEQHKE